MIECPVKNLGPRKNLHASLRRTSPRNASPVWFKGSLRQWLKLFHVTPRDELEAELTLLGLRSGAITVFERPYRGYAQYAICRRLAG